MTFAQLQVFAKVVETGSFTKAGEALNMTQSAVSHAVAGLESELGVSLIVRDRKPGVILSDFGRRVLGSVRDILSRMAQIEQEAAAEKGLEAGVIRIGSFPSAAARLLPKMIATFKSLHPDIEIVLFEGTDQEIVEWLDSRVIDVGFVAEASLGSRTIPLTKDKMVVVMPKGHPYGAAPAIPVTQLVDSPFIMSQGGCEPLIREIFDRSGLSPAVRFEVRDMSTILNMVKEGLGVTVVPELALPDTLQGLEFRDLDPPFWRHLGLCCRFGEEATLAVRTFIGMGQSLFHDDDPQRGGRS